MSHFTSLQVQRFGVDVHFSASVANKDDFGKIWGFGENDPLKLGWEGNTYVEVRIARKTRRLTYQRAKSVHIYW